MDEIYVNKSINLENEDNILESLKNSTIQPNKKYSITQIKKENILDSLEHNIIQTNNKYDSHYKNDAIDRNYTIDTIGTNDSYDTSNEYKKNNAIDIYDINNTTPRNDIYDIPNEYKKNNEYETNKKILDNTWKSCCLTVDKSAIKYFVQVFILFFLILLSSIMLVIDQNCNNQRNWSALLTLCLGVFIKAPSIGNK